MVTITEIGKLAETCRGDRDHRTKKKGHKENEDYAITCGMDAQKDTCDWKRIRKVGA